MCASEASAWDFSLRPAEYSCVFLKSIGCSNGIFGVKIHFVRVKSKGR